jgi:hypothetical protein
LEKMIADAGIYVRDSRACRNRSEICFSCPTEWAADRINSSAPYRLVRLS